MVLYGISSWQKALFLLDWLHLKMGSFFCQMSYSLNFVIFGSDFPEWVTVKGPGEHEGVPHDESAALPVGSRRVTELICVCVRVCAADQQGFGAPGSPTSQWPLFSRVGWTKTPPPRSASQLSAHWPSEPLRPLPIASKPLHSGVWERKVIALWTRGGGGQQGL